MPGKTLQLTLAVAGLLATGQRVAVVSKKDGIRGFESEEVWYGELEDQGLTFDRFKEAVDLLESDNPSWQQLGYSYSYEPLPMAEEPQKLYVSGYIGPDKPHKHKPNRRRFKQNARKAKRK